MVSGYAIVKEVVSGDTLVLIGAPRGGPPPELRLNLASLQAPKLGRGSNSKDEPFAWEAREFLRKLCVGKAVSFKVEYVVQSIGRTFGSIRLVEGNQENVCVTVAREGWARVKRESRELERSADLETMAAVGEEAQREGKGMFNTTVDAASSVRKVTYDVADAEALVKELGSKPQRAIIEYVRDGASFKALLVDSMTSITFNLSGVTCPRLNTGDNKNAAEEYSLEAKYFTELRLLNREVMIVLEGAEKSTFFGRIEHPAGDIRVELVQHGLAKLSYWTLKMCSAESSRALGEAQRYAMENKLRVWHTLTAQAPSSSAGESKFEGIISEVVSGDTIVIRCGTPEMVEAAPWACVERKVFLSSISAPRKKFLRNNDSAADMSEADRVENYNYNKARDYLRTKFVGKKCTVSIEYERGSNDKPDLPPRQYATVVVALRKQKVNLAVTMIQEGLCRIVHHRRDQLERSMYYDEIVSAHAAAEKAKKGVYSQNKSVADSAILDLIGNPTRARGHLPFLTRGTAQHKAIVEYIHNGARMKISIPSENCVLNFALAGVAAPQRARNANKGKPATEAEPFSNECLQMTRALVLQKDVEVEVETMDKGGCAIGSMYFVKGGVRTNLGVKLVEEGLAKVNEFSANLSPRGQDVINAEKAAKKSKLRVWENYDPAVEKAAKAAALAARGGLPQETKGGARGLDTKKVVVSEIVNGSTMYVQESSTEADKRKETVESALAAIAEADGVTPGASGTGVVEPKAGKNCLALFDDGSGMKWFRCTIVSVINDKSCMIRYLDFGNVEEVGMDRIRTADPSIFTTKALATKCVLSFLRVPKLEEEYGTESAMRFNDLVWGKQLVLKVVGKSEEGVQEVVAYDQDVVDEANAAAEKANKENAKEVEPETPAPAADDDVFAGLAASAPKKAPKKKVIPSPKSVNEVLVSDGLATIVKRPFAKSKEATTYVAALRVAQESAHRNHLNMWQYGDVQGEDAEEFGHVEK